MRIVKAIATTLMVLAAPAQALAENFRSDQSGNWLTPATWQMEDPNEPGKWIAPTHIPTTGDSVDIRHDVAITGFSYISTLTVSAGATLAINPSARLYLSGSYPQAAVTGAIVVKGELRLQPSAGPAALTLLSSQTLPVCGGAIMGMDTADQGELSVGSGVTMTNGGTIEGFLMIGGASAGVGTFRNEGTVTANLQARQLLVNSTLASISDNASAIWSVNWDSPNTELRINEPAPSLAGRFQLLTGAGRLAFGATVGNTSAPPFVVDHGTVLVDLGITFDYGTVSGSCAGRPSSNGSLSVGTYNYCLP